jgi:hypothetical protein
VSKTSRFADATVREFAAAKSLGVRAGSGHRYTFIWVVVVEERVFVRSWNDAPTGWYRAFRAEPTGSVKLNKRELPVRAVETRSARLRAAVSQGFAEKYTYKGAQKWVAGFAEAERAACTLELLPS